MFFTETIVIFLCVGLELFRITDWLFIFLSPSDNGKGLVLKTSHTCQSELYIYIKPEKIDIGSFPFTL